MVVEVGQRKPNLLLRRTLPLVAVVVLAGPGAASAGSGPDPAPSAAGLAPDPAPAATPRPASRANESAPTFLPPPPATQEARLTTQATAGVVSRVKPAATPGRRRSRGTSPPKPVAVRDVVPQAVDVPVGLGSVAGAIGKDAAPALAALALLAAAAAAASGAGVALAWSSRGGPAA